MVSQKQKKRIAWVLIIALINLVSIGMPGSGAVMATAHTSMAMEQGAALSQPVPGCHDTSMASKESMHEPVSDNSCTDCGEGCSLCFQISVVMPAIDTAMARLPEHFFQNDLPGLTGIGHDLILPPPRPLHS
jgi:hypothetical protein